VILAGTVTMAISNAVVLRTTVGCVVDRVSSEARMSIRSRARASQVEARSDRAPPAAAASDAVKP